jgi:acetylornithine deacetylase/succinyl-diaminopimelate desuccinylase-like protein
MSAALLIFLKRNSGSIQITRDIIFAGVADEEDGSRLGARFLVDNHPDLIAADIMFTEMGGFPTRMNDLGTEKILYPVQVAEKSFLDVKITAFGKGGHSSMRQPLNPIGALGEVAKKLVDEPLPLHVSREVHQSYGTIANSMSFPTAMILRGLCNHYTHDAVMRVLPPSMERATFAVFHNVSLLHCQRWDVITSLVLKDCVANDRERRNQE